MSNIVLICSNIANNLEKMATNMYYDTKPSDYVSSCANCGKPAHSQCSRCKLTHYCSHQCQRQHWGKYHKKHCPMITKGFDTTATILRVEDLKKIERDIEDGVLPSIELANKFRRTDLKVMMNFNTTPFTHGDFSPFRTFLNQIVWSVFSPKLMVSLTYLFRDRKFLELGAGSGVYRHWFNHTASIFGRSPFPWICTDILRKKGVVKLSGIEAVKRYKGPTAAAATAGPATAGPAAAEPSVHIDYNTIVLSWPEYHGSPSWVKEVIEYLVKTKSTCSIVFIGEWYGGSSMNDDSWVTLLKHYKVTRRWALPRFAHEFSFIGLLDPI